MLLFSPLVLSDSLQPHELQHARLPCSSPSHRACKLIAIELVTRSNYLVLCHPLLLLLSIFLSIRIFSNESVCHTRWPKYWSVSISPSNEYSGLSSFRIDWFDCLAVQGTVTWGLLIPIKSRTESVLLTFAFPLSIHLLCQSLSHVWLFATPRTVAPPAPLSRKFSGHEYWSRLLFRSQGDLPSPGTESRPPAF